MVEAFENFRASERGRKVIKMIRPSIRKPRSHAFTLIELLVVIAIIAILAAILFPVFAQAKLAAKKTAGLAQMKQIGTAAALYGGDNDDGLPAWSEFWAVYYGGGNPGATVSPPTDPNVRDEPQGYWDYKLAPYIKNGNLVQLDATGKALRNPDGSIVQDFSGLWKSPGVEYAPTRGRSLGVNQLLTWNILSGNSGGTLVNSTNVFSGGYRWPTGNIIDTPAETVFVADTGMAGRYDPPYFGNGFQQTFFGSTVPVGDEGYRCEPSKGDICRAAPWRYGKDSANYVFTDSHAKNEKGDKMYPNPGHTRPVSSWGTAINNSYCAARKYFAPPRARRIC